MWLASMSLRDDRGSIRGARNWCRKPLAFLGEKRKPWELMHWLLDGCGLPEFERCFRMNITLCLHRQASAEEVAALPEAWHKAPSGMAGGPVEILWERGVKATASALPCHDPGRAAPIPGRSDLWVPIDCGVCPPCLARLQIEKRDERYRPDESNKLNFFEKLRELEDEEGPLVKGVRILGPDGRPTRDLS